MEAALIILAVVLAAVVIAIVGIVAADIFKGKIKFKVKPKNDVKTVIKPKEKLGKKSVSPQHEIVNAAIGNVETFEEEETGEEESEESGDSVTRIKEVAEDGNVRYIVIKYSKSFIAKLIQSDENTKRCYSQIKNSLLSYKGVKSRISWKWEAFRAGRNTVAKLRLRGKTLSLCLALNADDYTGTKFHVESLSDVKSFSDTPCLYRIKNERRLRYSADLIADLMRKNGMEENEIAPAVDYAAQFPYETTEALIGRKLIKVLTDEEAQSGTQFAPVDIRRSVSVKEADSLMKDEVAATLLKKSASISDKTKAGIVNIDTLSQYFADGESVTLEEVIKRVPRISAKTTYLKVLARGTLDKTLTVEADSFSLQAVKMIVLTGGTAIKK